MFRDSRGVVHTVSSSDPLEDLPPSAAATLAGFLLVPVEGDLGGALERCEAAGLLLDSWQDAFFAALPVEVDRAEELRYAAEAGVDLDAVESDWTDDWPEEEDDWPQDDDEEDDDEEDEELALDMVDPVLRGQRSDPLLARLDAEVVAGLERDLLLLPLRVRLEALMAASALVEQWAELLADHEKCLGHLVLAHRESLAGRDHETLADRHATLHAGGAGHP